jgi:hypothetical protein
MQEVVGRGTSKSSLASLLLPNKVSRFSKVYPAGPLSLPEHSFTKGYATPTFKNDLK